MEIAHITGATRNLGAPKDWDASRDGPCGGLPIRDEMHSPTMPVMISAWTPTAEELAALNAGAPVHLSVLGAVHPPVWVWVGEPPAPVAAAFWRDDRRTPENGCCSAIEPCAHQRRSPNTLCEICAKAAALPACASSNVKGEPPDLRITVEDGKYTVVQAANGGLRALRYGEEWRDLTGDNLVLALAQEIETLRQSSRPITSA